MIPVGVNLVGELAPETVTVTFAMSIFSVNCSIVCGFPSPWSYTWTRTMKALGACGVDRAPERAIATTAIATIRERREMFRAVWLFFANVFRLYLDVDERRTPGVQFQ